jgi:hypothetical protein
MASISKLPDEMLVMIFSYLDIDDLSLSVRNVCEHWRSVSEDDTLWKNLCYCPSRTTPKQELIRRLKSMPALRYFSYNGTQNVLGTISEHCTKLKHLHTSFMRINARHLEAAISSLHSLETLSIRISKLPILPQTIAKAENLVTLNLTTCGGLQTTNHLLKPIAHGCPKLRNLSCAFLDCPTEEFCYLLKCKKDALQEYEHYGLLSAAVFMAINECTKLQKLRLKQISIEGPFDETIFFTKLKCLTLVEFAGCPVALLQSIPRSLSLSPFPYLEHIDMSMAFDKIDEITDSVLLACPLLKDLVLSENSEFYGYGLKNISNCKMLNRLDMASCMNLNWSALKYVAEGSPQLRYLNLSCNRITRAMFHQILRCRNLEALFLWRCDLRHLDLQLIKTHLTKLIYLYEDKLIQYDT